MKLKFLIPALIMILGTCLISSCQKELDGFTTGGIPATVDQYPKVGTTWTYDYYWYTHMGGPTHSKIITHRAKSEETLGGEKWLKIADVDTDTTVYFLKTKPEGLYQYANNNAYLLCKYPAAVNDTYTTFNGGSVETFTVLAVNDSTGTILGRIPLSMYEGVKTGYIIDEIWYNKNAWIVWQYQYKLVPVSPSPIYYLYSKMFLRSIIY